jgi:anti-sigma factor RsiW
MSDHLSQEQIARWMLGMREEAASRHLAACAACRAEVDGFEETISRFRASVHAAAQREEPFWSRQKVAIGERLAASRPIRFPRWVPVTVMAAIVFVALLLTRPPRAPQHPAKSDGDEALLMEVQRDVGREFPVALAPAVLIAEERNEILTSQANKQPQDSLTERRQEK